MPETITERHGIRAWRWYDVMYDLREQGGLEDVVIDPMSFTHVGSGGGYLNGNCFYFTWKRDEFLLVSMQEFSQELIDAFSAVVGYQPFCRYKHKAHELWMWTVEWDKIDPSGCWEERGLDPDVYELVRITEARDA